jgi:K+ transporter
VAERAGWRARRPRLFTLLQRNAADATEHYNIPVEQVITVGIPLSVPSKQCDSLELSLQMGPGEFAR